MLQMSGYRGAGTRYKPMLDIYTKVEAGTRYKPMLDIYTKVEAAIPVSEPYLHPIKAPIPPKYKEHGSCSWHNRNTCR
jgi:hypothetical protein